MIQKLQQKLMNDNDEESRRSAVQGLRNFPINEVCIFLLQAMGDASWRVRKEAVDAFIAAKPLEEHIVSLLDLFRSEDNAGQRNSAAEAITRLASQAIPSLIKLLHDHDPDVRKFVIDVMGNIHSKECLFPLIDALKDTDCNVAAAAAEQLGALGDNSAVATIMDAIIHNESDFFRFNALTAIGKFNAPTLVPSEILALVSNEILRKAVYECLGSIGDSSVCTILIEGIFSRQKSSRNAALIALYRIFNRSSKDDKQQLETCLQKYKGNKIVSTIKDLYSTTDDTIAEAVIVLLDLIGDSNAVDVLLKGFSNERLAPIALRSIKRLCPETMSRIVSMYDSVDDTARAAICILCAECRYSEASVIVQKGLIDSSSIVRQSAAVAVGKLCLVDCLPSLVFLLDDEEKDINNAAINSLQSLALVDRSSIEGVVDRLFHSVKSHHRRVAALLSAALGDGERLLLLVKDEDPQVRQASVIAMGISHLTGIESTLVMALVDEDPDVQIAAAEVISETGLATLVAPLISALADDDVWVQCAVLKSVVKLSSTAGFNEIKRLLPNASGLLLITVLQLLNGYTCEETISLAMQFINHPDKDVSSLAKEIVEKHTYKQDNA